MKPTAHDFRKSRDLLRIRPPYLQNTPLAHFPVRPSRSPRPVTQQVPAIDAIASGATIDIHGSVGNPEIAISI